MIFLSLGSNLKSTFGNKKENLKIALSLLETYDFKIIKKSSFYETESYPNKSDPKFINMIISGQSDLSPDQLMEILLDIEKRLERVREKKNEPRTCDIDIIDYNGKFFSFNCKGFDFIVPHEKAICRNFVLFPLQEIAPNWIHPKTKEKITTLIEKLSEEERKSILKISKN